MIAPGVLARTVSDYTHRRPSESPTLAPLWQTLAQHAKAGACHHRGTCPLVTVGPVVVNEHHEVLMVRGGRAPARLPEARLTEGFDTLTEAAFDHRYRYDTVGYILRRQIGLRDKIPSLIIELCNSRRHRLQRRQRHFAVRFEGRGSNQFVFRK